MKFTWGPTSMLPRWQASSISSRARAAMTSVGAAVQVEAGEGGREAGEGGREAGEGAISMVARLTHASACPPATASS
jgi:hypothetical protein